MMVFFDLNQVRKCIKMQLDEYLYNYCSCSGNFLSEPNANKIRRKYEGIPYQIIIQFLCNFDGYPSCLIPQE